MSVRVDPDAVPDDDTVTGSRTRVVDRLRGFLDLGFTGLSFIPAGPGRTDQMRRIAEEVIPELRDAVSGK